MTRRSRPGADALRARVAALREDLRARRGRRPEPRRRWWPWVLLALVLLLLLRLCSCADPPLVPVAPPPGVPVGPGGGGEPVAPVPHSERDPPIARRDRPDYATAPPEPLPWVTSFRLQVSSRSPRLAQCFVGAPRPGALKWTAAVEPASGRVSDHTLAPALETDPLTAAQRACVVAVLSDPPYRLETGDEPATPSRVAMAIEF